MTFKGYIEEHEGQGWCGVVEAWDALGRCAGTGYTEYAPTREEAMELLMEARGRIRGAIDRIGLKVVLPEAN